MARGLRINGRIERVKTVLDFGDVASAMVEGSSRAGWLCPCCLGPNTLKECHQDKGAKCRACGEGFDILKLVMRVKRLPSVQALADLEALADAKDARAAGHGPTPDLFGGEA